jgi:hypothetical protein
MVERVEAAAVSGREMSAGKTEPFVSVPNDFSSRTRTVVPDSSGRENVGSAGWATVQWAWITTRSDDSAPWLWSLATSRHAAGSRTAARP